MLQVDHSGSVILAGMICSSEIAVGLNVGLAELVLTRGWYLWWERSQATHGEPVQRPSRSAVSIIALTSNYNRSQKRVAVVREGWRKPPEGKLMLNVDAAFCEDQGCGSTGAIIRDANGGFIAAVQSFLPHNVDVPMVEAYALKEGLTLAKHVGCNRFIVQTDCMAVVDTLKDGGFSATAGAAIYDECMRDWRVSMMFKSITAAGKRMR